MRTCPQCYNPRPDDSFLSLAEGAQCEPCRAHYRLPPSVRPVKEWRSSTPRDEALRVRFTPLSGNRKTGPIPVSTSSPVTCPPSCSWYGAGCYAENSYTGHRWRQTPEVGLDWEEFCQKVRELPEGQLWRHNEAGDLPGVGEELDAEKFSALVKANRGRRGFTFTHKWKNLGLIATANAYGFTVNKSCDSLDEVRITRSLHPKLPLTVVVPTSEQRRFWKDGEISFIRCPAQVLDEMTCEKCQLCQRASRKSVVVFHPHGQSSKQMEERLVQLSLPMRKENT